jgi:hypothetical protein
MYSSSPMTAVSEMLGDYVLYTLPVRTEVASHQTKQVAFLDRPAVKFERVYSDTFGLGWDNKDVDGPEAAKVRYRLQNRQDAGLGKPMPGGKISVIDSDERGAPVFVGDAAIRDTPEGLPVNLNTGDALAVRVLPRIAKLDTRGKGKNAWRHDAVEITIYNDMGKPIPFELSLDADRPGTRITDEDAPHILDEGVMKWKLSLAAGERKVFHYSVDYPLDY